MTAFYGVLTSKSFFDLHETISNNISFGLVNRLLGFHVAERYLSTKSLDSFLISLDDSSRQILFDHFSK